MQNTPTSQTHQSHSADEAPAPITQPGWETAGFVYWTPIEALKLNPKNPRRHSKRQIAQLAAAMKKFDFINPVIIDEDDTVLAGHARIAAAKQLGEGIVKTIRVDHLNAEDKKAYIIAENQLAALAGWDQELLREELAGLVEINYEVELTGFLTVEIDRILEISPGSAGHSTAREEENTEPQPGPAVSRHGDLWQIGPHRLLCGNALDLADYQTLLQGEKAEMIFTDPPYNVEIAGNVCGSGQIKHREFMMASGEMSQAEFAQFLEQAFRAMAQHSIDGAVHFICMDWRHIQEITAAGNKAYTELKNLCIWAKTNGGMGTFYRSRHELVFVYISGNGKPINNFGLGENGRYRTNVWEYEGVNSLAHGRREELKLHPTVKPIGLVADAIRDCSKRKGLILDPFAGSGTTLLACHKTGRMARLMELDPLYVDVIIRRQQAITGIEARLASSGKSFNQVAAERLKEATSTSSSELD